MTTPEAKTVETPSGKNRATENFPVGSFLIRPALRKHVHAFYNFARAADDIADHPLLDPEVKVARLERFAAVLYGDSGNDVPSATVMRASLNETGVPMQHCLDLLTAFMRDATQLRYRDWLDLLDYCRYSASPVGRHVLALHGIGESAWPANDALCSALQIINHIQDCAEDYAQLDRVYIPQDMLLESGAQTEELAQKSLTEGMRKTLDTMLARLDEMMPEACNLPKCVPDIRLKCETSVICVIAERLIMLLKQNDPLCNNVKLGKVSVAAATLNGIARAWF